MNKDRRSLAALISVVLLALTIGLSGLLMTGCSKTPETTTTTTEATKTLQLEPGQNYPITESAELDTLIVGDGATITPPQGKSVTLTVNGTEQGQKLATTTGYDLIFVAGTYTGDVRLVVADANPVEYKPARSSGSPQRPAGMRSSICRLRVSSACNAAVFAVRM